MRFDVDWLTDGPNAVPEERATIADLAISIGGRNACENEQPRRRCKGGRGTGSRNVRPATAATVSVYPLAEEIAFNWWRLFGGRDTELQLVDGRGGYAVPDVRLAYEGVQFEARCEPIEYENPKVRFTVPCGERLTRAQAEAALTDFVERVVAQLAAGGVRESGLQLRWARVQASRRNAGESAFCEAAGALGIDPYGVEDEDAEFIASAGALFSGEPLAELLSGLTVLRQRAIASDRAVIEWLRRAEARESSLSSLPAVGDLRRGMADSRRASTGEPPWCAGYRCANAARQRLNIGIGERFDVMSLAARLGGTAFHTAGSISGVRAVVRWCGEAAHVHLRTANSRYAQESELFALGRAVGDAVANPPAERSAVNDLRNAARQAAGRAFAAEFLAPIDEILSMRNDGKDLYDMAADLGVAEEVVERQLQNRERIEAAIRR